MNLAQPIMYAADALLLAAYIMLGRKRLKQGFILSFLSSICFVIGGIEIQQPAVWGMNIVFALINGWSIYRCYVPQRKQTRTDRRCRHFGLYPYGEDE
jgi:hypothetical protein